MEAVVDGLATAAALALDLPVFEAGDDVFDAGADAAVFAVVVVVDDPSGVVALRAGDSGDALAGVNKAVRARVVRLVDT